MLTRFFAETFSSEKAFQRADRREQNTVLMGLYADQATHLSIAIQT
jgi:hypothetical protein